jgi:hypothetical protein
MACSQLIGRHDVDVVRRCRGPRAGPKRDARGACGIDIWCAVNTPLPLLMKNSAGPRCHRRSRRRDRRRDVGSGDGDRAAFTH